MSASGDSFVKLDDSHEHSENIVKDEIAAAEKVINAMLFYERYVVYQFKRQVKAVKSLSMQDQCCLSSVFQPHVKEALHCASANQKVLNLIVKAGMQMFSNNTSFQQAYEQVRKSAGSSEHYMSKCRSTLKQIVREWSADGAGERYGCYNRVLEAIRSRYPNKMQRHNVKILVPGCGLGRLNWELLDDGFSVTGNEFSFFMILTSNFLLNCCKKANEFTIYPNILDFSNCWSYSDSLRAVTFPDVDPSSNLESHSRPNSFSMCAGDFLDAFKSESNQFDSVVTVFFLDTASNLFDYLRTIFRILKPGGSWINFGPLTYHFEGEDENSIELPFETIVQVAEQIGFHMERVEGKNVNPPALYTHNPNSMLNYQYHCVRMYKYFSFRRTDEVANDDIKGTAIDCTSDGQTLVVADCCEFQFINLEASAVVQKCSRSTHKPAHILKCHPSNENLFAAAAGPTIEFVVDGSFLTPVVQASRITDFDYDPYDENTSTRFETTNQSTSRSVWCSTIKILTSSKSFVDISWRRSTNTTAPVKQFIATQTERIVALEVHPTNPNVMLTSSVDNFKLWDCSNEMQPNFVILDHENVGKFRFSSSGEIFVSLDYPSNSGTENTVCLWQLNSFGNAQELRRTVSDKYVDFCWQKQEEEESDSFNYLFTYSERCGLLKHLVLSNTTNEPVEEMAIPMAQSAEDEARDQMLMFVTRGQVEIINHRNMPNDKEEDELRSSLNDPPDEVTESPRTWSSWVYAPNLNETCDLLVELRALRKFDVVGLTTNEVNFQRAAVAISFTHPALSGRIVIELRFHRNFVKNGWVLLDIVKQDSPLDSKMAADLLKKLKTECREQTKNRDGKLTVLWRALRSLPKMLQGINEMFDKTPQLSGSENGITECDETETRPFPIGYQTSEYDEHVPAPRLCGIRFNRAGLLTVFGEPLIKFGRQSTIKSTIEEINYQERKNTRGNQVSKTHQTKKRISIVTNLITYEGKRTLQTSKHSTTIGIESTTRC
ncbi:Carnosine N-methyltransferase [Aphelenchoides besseyi]|nr:Carnosine N-methyltransferase [Aphelenchoides besseyi]